MQEFTTRPELAGTFGMVASTHWLASAAGMAILESGGNAFDAAVATGLVLQVVEPHLNGPGGEVPVIGYSRAGGGPFVIDGQGPAPAAATLEPFGAPGIHLIPGNGLLAATVPAAFGAWMLLLKQYGTLRLRDVMTYAIGYASDGYPMLGGASAVIDAMAATFTRYWPSSAEIYLAEGTPAPGGRFANKSLADTYIRVLAEAEAASSDRDAQIEAARRAWYEGFVAEAIDVFVASAQIMDVTGRPSRGLLAGSDLAGWHASVEEPVRFGFRGLTVCKTGPWGQGPVFCQQLAMLDGFDLEGMGPGSSALIHTVTEVAKLAFADREAWYGDPRHSEVPLADLLSPEYAAERRQLVTDQAAAGLQPGSPGGRQPRTTLSPGMVLRDGEPYMAFGTPGGDQQDQWTVGFFLNHAVFGMNLQEAIDFPAYHTDHFPSSFYPREAFPLSLCVESRAGEGVIADLRGRGHDLSGSPPWALGRVSAARSDRGFPYAGANARRLQGYTAGG